MTSITYGEVGMERIARIIAERASVPGGTYNVMIGTDSQNFDTTKVVVVIAFQHEGHGGVFFYDVSRVRRIDNISQKLQYETSLSLQYAQELMMALDVLRDTGEFDYKSRLNIGIHVDAGENGPSRKVIPEIVGWINAMGFEAMTKPDSYAASSIANKFSK